LASVTDARSEETTGFGLHVGFQLKDMRSEGTSTLDFNHRAAVKRHAFVTFNIGNLYQRFGQDERYFKARVLSQEWTRQREIRIAVDGALLPEFDSMVNNVSITLRKQHDRGEVTMRELVIDKGVVNDAAADLRMVYGWRGDTNFEDWLNYEYRTRWSFKGGGHYETDWQTTNAAMIDLYVPYQRRLIQVLNTGVDLADHDVRAVVVKISYPFFGRVQSEQRVIRTDSAIEQNFEITLPNDTFEYSYQMTWVMNSGDDRPSTSGSDSSGLVFLDPPAMN